MQAKYSTPTWFAARTAAGEAVVRTQAFDRDHEEEALVVLTAAAFSKAKTAGPLELVVEWPDISIAVGRIEGDEVNWVLGGDQGLAAFCLHYHVNEVETERGPVAACLDCGRVWA